ncbi:acyl-CoA dehydrogenase family protein [Spirillospora sp. CA-255316]
MRSTGLEGALTRAIELLGDGVALSGDVTAGRARLWLGAAAVAAGIADAAAETALDYCANRHLFGAALTALPTVRDTLFGALALAEATL